MSRRGDNIHRRKDGRWEGRCKLGINEKGKAIYHSIYGKTYTDCKKKLEEYALAYKLPEIHLTRSADVRFSYILTLWLKTNEIRIKGSTLNKYHYMIQNHIIPELGELDINHITAVTINNFLSKKLSEGSKSNEKLSPSYVKTMAIIIESAIRLAVAEGMCDPLKSSIYKPTVPKSRVSTLSATYLKRLEKMLTTEKNGTSLGTLIALHTGMRIGEICALSWSDVDLANKVIHVQHTVSRVKNSSESNSTKLILDSPKTPSSNRIIPISSVLAPILEQAFKYKESDYVISDNASFVGTRTFDYRYRQMLIRNNFAVANFHTIRHTFASRCVEAGMDVKTLSEILGHSSVSTTLNTYVHSSMRNKRAQLEKIYALNNGQNCCQ